jgi:hypothetical protein
MTVHVSSFFFAAGEIERMELFARWQHLAMQETMAVFTS